MAQSDLIERLRRGGEAEAADEIEQLRKRCARMDALLSDLEYAFAESGEIQETTFTLHALDAIRRVRGDGAKTGE